MTESIGIESIASVSIEIESIEVGTVTENIVAGAEETSQWIEIEWLSKRNVIEPYDIDSIKSIDIHKYTYTLFFL